MFGEPCLRKKIVCLFQTTFQAVVTTDGRSSFVALVYTNDGVEIEGLRTTKLVGFDAGDGIRSATVLSQGFSGIENLTSVNVFRVDGEGRGGRHREGRRGKYHMYLPTIQFFTSNQAIPPTFFQK